MPRKKSYFLAVLESTFSDFFFFFRRYIITATTLAAQSENNISSSAISKFAPKWAHVAQHTLNEYSASRNNLLTNVEPCIIGLTHSFKMPRENSWWLFWNREKVYLSHFTYFVTTVTVGIEGKTMIYICFVSFTKQTSLGKRVNDPTLSFYKYLLYSRNLKLKLKYKEIFHPVTVATNNRQRKYIILHFCHWE